MWVFDPAAVSELSGGEYVLSGTGAFALDHENALLRYASNSRQSRSPPRQHEVQGTKRVDL
jgi:hypothetical protein